MRIIIIVVVLLLLVLLLVVGPIRAPWPVEYFETPKYSKRELDNFVVVESGDRLFLKNKHNTTGQITIVNASGVAVEGLSHNALVSVLGANIVKQNADAPADVKDVIGLSKSEVRAFNLTDSQKQSLHLA